MIRRLRESLEQNRQSGGTLSRRIALVTAGVAFLVGLVVGLTAISALRESETLRLTTAIERDALILAGDLSALPSVEWKRRLTDYEKTNGARVTVVDARSKVVFDTGATVKGDSFDRPELAQALTGAVVSGARPSTTLNQPLHYTAVPVRKDGVILGAVRLAMSASVIDEKINPLQWGLGAVLALALAVGIVAAWLVGSAISRPLERLAIAARLVGDDPTRRVGPTGGPREVRQVGEALDETTARLDESLERSQSVAAEASHHLRTPLAALRLRVEAISDLSEGEVHEEAEGVLVEVDRLNRRIEQILAIARAGVNTAKVTVEVGAAAVARLGNWEEIAATRGITLIGDEGPEPAFALLPPGTVERAVDELVGNALSYAVSTVSVTCGCDEKFAWVDVADDGPGISKHERDLVFQRYFRGSASIPGGSGLGLALLRDASRSNGGDAILLESARGAALRVTWPRCKMEE